MSKVRPWIRSFTQRGKKKKKRRRRLAREGLVPPRSSSVLYLSSPYCLKKQTKKKPSLSGDGGNDSADHKSLGQSASTPSCLSCSSLMGSVQQWLSPSKPPCASVCLWSKSPALLLEAGAGAFQIPCEKQTPNLPPNPPCLLVLLLLMLLIGFSVIKC